MVTSPNWSNVLIASAKVNDIEAAKKALKNGVNPNVVDCDNNNALAIAIKNKNWDIINLLLDWNVNVNVVDANGNSPLYLAQGNIEIQKKLISSGAEFTNKEKQEIEQSLALNNQLAIAQIATNYQQLDKISEFELIPTIIEKIQELILFFSSASDDVNSLTPKSESSEQTFNNNIWQSNCEIESEKKSELLNNFVNKLNNYWNDNNITNHDKKIEFLNQLLQQIENDLQAQYDNNSNNFDENTDNFAFTYKRGLATKG